MPTPWEKRAEELRTTEGGYADFVAWREWLMACHDRHRKGGSDVELTPNVLDGLSTLDSIPLYGVFCEFADFFDEPADLAERVERMLDEEIIVREGLAYEGRGILDALTITLSLREIGRRTGVSPTYLSMVHHGKSIISPGAYLKLDELYKQVTEL